MFTVPGDEIPARPGWLYGGAVAAVVGLLAAGIEGYFWLRAYTTLTGKLPEDTTASEDVQTSLAIYDSYAVTVVIVSLLISLIVVVGAIAALRGANGGRIAMWISGGFAIAWHLCCSGYVLFFRALFAQAAAQANADATADNDFHIEEHFPVWLIDSAIGAGFTVAVASIVAVTLIALSPVNRYYRALRTPPVQRPGGPGRW